MSESSDPDPDSAPTGMVNEEQWVEAALEGNSEALDQLLLLYYDRALAYISGRMSESQHRHFEPADILQATYMKAYRHIDTFKPQHKHSFFAWIKQIADHQLYDESRKMTRRANVGLATQKAGSGSYFDMMAAVPGNDPTATALFKKKELEGAFHLAMAKLDARYQEAIRLRYLEEHPMPEVAQALGVTEDALRGILHRARKKLIAELNRLSHYV